MYTIDLLQMVNILLFLFCFKPFSQKLANETDADKRAMLERILGKVKVAMEVAETALKEKESKETHPEAKQVREDE